MMRSAPLAQLCLLVLAACLSAAGILEAQKPPKETPKPEEHPNFSGTWVMNPEKSNWGEVGAPDVMRYAIRHTGANLILVSTQDSVTKRLEMTTDGLERITEEDADSEILARVYWDGKTLVWEGRRKAKPAHQVDSITWTSRWSLSDDVKVITIKREIKVVQGTLQQTIVMDKK